MHTFSPRSLRSRGFTLIEVIAAITIFAVTIVAVFSVIEGTRKAYEKGTVSMERYQGIRIGLDRFLADIRSAVSPQSQWNNMPETEEELEEEIDELVYEEEYDEEPPEVYIRFHGTSSEVTFVVEDISRKKTERYFDLREVRYYVDKERKALVREIHDSVVRRRMNEFRVLQAENETDFLAANPYAFEWDGIGEQTVIAYHVEDMQISYYDGAETYNEWDSEKEVPREDEGEYEEGYFDDEETMDPRLAGNRVADEQRKEKYGLPDAVGVLLILDNAQEMLSVTNVPGRDFDLIMVMNETAFGQRTLASRVRYNRENNEGPRKSRRADEDRASLLDAFDDSSYHRSSVRRQIYEDSRSGSRSRTRPDFRSSRHTGRESRFGRSPFRDRR